ncbi:MAG: hypothetical protein LUQ71_06275 [Methanoregula sp.]|nr:hypothetical protein [Methanoregula sp.]
MDDLIRCGMVVILVFFVAGIAFLYGIAWLVMRELHAWAAGDTGFILASTGCVLLLCAGYIGTGLWLRHTGRI